MQTEWITGLLLISCSIYWRRFCRTNCRFFSTATGFLPAGNYTSLRPPRSRRSTMNYCYVADTVNLSCLLDLQQLPLTLNMKLVFFLALRRESVTSYIECWARQLEVDRGLTQLIQLPAAAFNTQCSLLLIVFEEPEKRRGPLIHAELHWLNEPERSASCTNAVWSFIAVIAVLPLSIYGGTLRSSLCDCLKAASTFRWQYCDSTTVPCLKTFFLFRVLE